MNNTTYISFFQSFVAGMKPQSEKIELSEFLHAVKFGKWQKQIEAVRAEEDKEKRNSLKRTLPSVTISGIFGKRKESELLQHSGYLCIDIDNYNETDSLKKDPYTYALFKSTSGNGLAVIVKIKGEKHKESFRWVQNYYYKNYGIVIDPAPSNVASLRFVSYDPELLLNEKAKVCLTLEEKRKKRHSLPIIADDDDIKKMLEDMQKVGANIAETYEEYRNISFAISEGFGEGGRPYFHIIASQSSKYQAQHADKQYDIALRRRGSGGIGVGTLYWMLKQAGVAIKPKYERAVHITSVAKKADRKPEAVKTQLIEMEKVDPDIASKIVDEVYSRDDLDPDHAMVSPKAVMEGIAAFLRQNYPMRKNSLTGKIEVNGEEITQEILNTIYLQTRSFFDSKEVTKDIIESIIFSEMTEVYHPISEYFEKNSHRNTTGNIDKLIRSIESNTPMREVFIRKWLISLIAASDGNPVRSVLALTGAQNSGKTEFFRRLLPSSLRKYYGESKLDSGKDDELLMCQKLIVMDDEMGGKSKQDEKRFKELTSKQVFSLRAPYARFNEDYQRLAVLCGTSNDPALVTDPTGNTRILPIEVISIDHELYNSIDKDELLMEAYRAYVVGEAWQLSKEEIEQLKLLSGEFEQIPFERELVYEFLEIPGEGDFTEAMSTTMIKNYIECQTQQKIQSIRKLGIELQKIFGKPYKRNGVHVYFLKKRQ